MPVGHTAFDRLLQTYLQVLFFQSNVAVSRLSSVSSQDSGFTSQEQFYARPPSPLEEAEVSIVSLAVLSFD